MTRMPAWGGLLLAQDQDLSWRQVPVSRQAFHVGAEYQVSERWGMVEVVGELELELERAVGAGQVCSRSSRNGPFRLAPTPAAQDLVSPAQPFTCQSVRPTNHTPPLGLGNFFPQYCTESLSAAQRLSAFRPLDAAGARWCTGPWCAALLQGRCHGCNAGTY
jgi:hypothetical protein